MTLVLPRLDRTSAQLLLGRYRHQPLPELTARMPDLTASVTYAAVGGARIDPSTLRTLRSDILQLAAAHGMPDQIQEVGAFEGRCAQLVRTALPITPHEASHEEVWSYLTCCWLLDIAVWRFGSEASDDRFIGHVNRNTFRRMWWRQEVLGPAADLTRLGEDELVNIMERPTLFADGRVARAIAREFLARVDRGGVRDRMRLMREVTKRLLRLTPFLAFASLADVQVDLIVGDAFDAAVAGLEGQPAAMPQRTSDSRSEASPDVEDMAVLAPQQAASSPTLSEGRRVMEFEEVARAAIDIARTTGRVTNTALREIASISSEEARAILQSLVQRNELARRGAKRGTHYVIPERGGSQVDDGPGARDQRSPAEPQDEERATETALRRLLRRPGLP